MLATALVLLAPSLAARSCDVADVLRILEREAARPEGAGARLERELAALGPALAPDLFTVLAFGGGPARAATAAEEEALLAALSSFGPVPLRAFLQRRLAAAPPPEERHAALRLLARLAGSEDLTLVRRCMQGAGPGLEEALQAACAGLLARDPRAFEPVRRWMIEAPLGIAVALVRGAADSGRPEALRVLTDALGYRADLEPELLAGLAHLAARAPKPLEEELLAPLVEFLADEDPCRVREAALALGHAEDAGALPALIPLLGHEHRGVRLGAQWALEHITALRLGPSPGRWLAWLRAEEQWSAREGERLRAELRSPSEALAIRALGELSSHRWRRHELALEVAQALEHEQPAVRRLACLVLGRLGSSAVRAPLEAVLEDRDETVAEAAHRALVTLALDPGASRRRIAPRRSSRPGPRPRKRTR